MRWRPAVREFIDAVAAQSGLSPANVIAAAYGLTFAPIDATIARRCGEIEDAAGLQAGGVIDALVEHAEIWWGEDPAGAETLESWVAAGWPLRDPDAALARLRALRARWRMEDEAADTTGGN